MGNEEDYCVSLGIKIQRKNKNNSVAGIRTRVSRVRADDYSKMIETKIIKREAFPIDHSQQKEKGLKSRRPECIYTHIPDKVSASDRI
ncbi:hypothetical protein YC2023_103001 [Brassica napus]